MDNGIYPFKKLNQRISNDIQIGSEPYRYRFEDDDEDENEDDEGDINTKADIFRNLEGSDDRELPKILQEELEKNHEVYTGGYREYEQRFSNRGRSGNYSDNELFNERI